MIWLVIGALAVAFVILRRVERWQQQEAVRQLAILDILSRLNEQDELLATQIEAVAMSQPVEYEMHMN